MSLKWIGKGVFKVGDKLLEHGDDIPATVPRKRINKLKKQGLIGVVTEIAKPEPVKVNSKDGSKPPATGGK
jgi:hypothetical protein